MNGGRHKGGPWATGEEGRLAARLPPAASGQETRLSAAVALQDGLGGDAGLAGVSPGSAVLGVGQGHACPSCAPWGGELNWGRDQKCDHAHAITNPTRVCTSHVTKK